MSSQAVQWMRMWRCCLERVLSAQEKHITSFFVQACVLHTSRVSEWNKLKKCGAERCPHPAGKRQSPAQWPDPSRSLQMMHALALLLI